jgi:acetyltransferase-like isoleucine patch superfamily enzyme
VPVVSWVVARAAQYAGRNAFGFALRSCYWKAKLKHLGQDTLIEQGVEIHGAERIEIGHHSFLGTNVRLSAGAGSPDRPGSISIGDYTFVGPNSMISGSGTALIGDFVAISASVYVYTATNVHADPNCPDVLLSMSHSAPFDRQHAITGTVSIEDYVTVCPFVVILPNVNLGCGAIVQSFCHVVRSFPEFANIVGPGKARQNGVRRSPVRRRINYEPRVESRCCAVG